MLYTVKVTLNDDSIRTFEHEANDAIEAMRHFRMDASTEAVAAKTELKSIDAYPAE